MIFEAKCEMRECIHYEGIKWLDGTEETETHYCKAFPNGIPGDIWNGDNLHNEPVEGDNGIQYEGPDPEGKLIPNAEY